MSNKNYFDLKTQEELLGLVFVVCDLENKIIKDEKKLEEELIYTLAYNASVNENKEIKQESINIINKIAEIYNLKTGSNFDFYNQKKNEEYEFFTVPAINSRMLTMHTVKSAVKVAENLKLPHLIFELALSESDYTGQQMQEYSAMAKTAYISLGLKDKIIYLQADHCQLDPKKYEENNEEELNRIKNAIKKALEAGVYNIDIDTSKFETIDDKKTDRENQFENAKHTAELLYFIREYERKNNLEISVSVGGEVGEVGGGNTKYPHVNAYLEILHEELTKLSGETYRGLDKVSINVGSAHGGVLGSDGKPLETVPLDFQAHHDLYMKAKDPLDRDRKVLSVQHGASTLPKNYFPLFPAMHVAEVHLATGFQNLVWEVLEKEDVELFNKMKSLTEEKFADKIAKYETPEIGFMKERKRVTEFVKKDLLMSDAIGKIEEALELEFSVLFYSLYNILLPKGDNVQSGDRAD